MFESATSGVVDDSVAILGIFGESSSFTSLKSHNHFKMKTIAIGSMLEIARKKAKHKAQVGYGIVSV